MTHIARIIEYPVRQIVEQIRHESNFLKRNKRKLLFRLILSFKFDIVDNYKSLANNETKQIQELLIVQRLFEHLIMVLASLQAEHRNRVLLADVLVQNHEDVRSVEDLANNLSSLFCVQFFEDVQYFCDDLADTQNWFHIVLRFEVFHVVIEDFTDYFFSDHLAHFVSAHFLSDVDELFCGLCGRRRACVVVGVQMTALRIRVDVHGSLLLLFNLFGLLGEPVFFPALDLALDD
jgi:hypothetical protein